MVDPSVVKKVEAKFVDGTAVVLPGVLATCVVVAFSVLDTTVEDSSVVKLVLAAYVESRLVVLSAVVSSDVVDSSVVNSVVAIFVDEATVVLAI